MGREGKKRLINTRLTECLLLPGKSKSCLSQLVRFWPQSHFARPVSNHHCAHTASANLVRSHQLGHTAMHNRSLSMQGSRGPVKGARTNYWTGRRKVIGKETLGCWEGSWKFQARTGKGHKRTSLRPCHGRVHTKYSRGVEKTSDQRQPAGSSCALAFGSCVEAADTVGKKGTSIDGEVVLGMKEDDKKRNSVAKPYMCARPIFSSFVLCILLAPFSPLILLPQHWSLPSPPLPSSLPPPPFISMMKLLLGLGRTCRSGIRCLLLRRLHHAPIM